jgi:cytoskeletal protein CcmA (bactofilin family)
MKDDVAPPNLGQANKDFDAQYFWTSYRSIEQWMSQLVSKGNIKVASLTADTATIDDDLTIVGAIHVGGAAYITGNLYAGATTLDSLIVSHGATVNGDLSSYGTTTLYDTSTYNLSVIGNVTATGDVTVGDDLTVTGDATVGTLGVTGTSTYGGNMTVTGDVLPNVTATRNLGSSSLRWATIYTSDLSLKNDVGDWTIVEGEDDLFITNNKSGKKYKFALIEVGDVD